MVQKEVGDDIEKMVSANGCGDDVVCGCDGSRRLGYD